MLVSNNAVYFQSKTKHFLLQQTYSIKHGFHLSFPLFLANASELEYENFFHI